MSVLVNIGKINALRGLRSNFNQVQKALYSSKSASLLEYERDPQALFTDAETQTLLQSMTQLQLDKVFRKTTVADNSVENKFMTTPQLEKEFRRTIGRARGRLQMPPVVQVKNDDEHRIISKDPALTGYSDSKFVFTDITYGLKQSDRKVVVREMDGTLEYASLELAKRMNQLYFPLPGRKIRTPAMFKDETHFRNCLDEHKYEFILDRLTVQYEPYEKDFHQLSSQVYQHLNETKKFDLLRSTRHFGPMAFFYAWHRCIDDLLYDMIRRDYMRNAVELIALMYKIHGISSEVAQVLEQENNIRGSVISDEQLAAQLLNQALKDSAKESSNVSSNIQDEIQSAIGKTAADFQADEVCLQFIEKYIAGANSLKKVQLELAVQTLKEINAEKRQLFEGLNKAHGVQ